MGILDWFKNRPSHPDPGRLSDEMTRRAIDKAVTLTNPRLKIVRSYQERLAPAVETSIRYLREKMLELPPAIRISEANWASEHVLRAFFASAAEIPAALRQSRNLRTLFDKFPDLDEACLVLGMTYNEQQSYGMSLQGDIVQRDVAQTVVDFSVPRTRICGHSDEEVRHLLGTQSFEYLVAQSMIEIGEAQSERQELEETRALIRFRLRLLQQQGPGLGTVFDAAPPVRDEQQKLEAELLENERQMEELGGSQSTLEEELDCLRDVLEHPESYIRFERKKLRLSTLNVILDDASTDVSSEVEFSLVNLDGVPKVRRAFVLGRLARSELPVARMNFEDAARYL